MTTKKTLTLNGLVLPNFIFMALNLGMIFVSIYLTSHYMGTHYPEGLKASSTLCNINDFWGCDKATLSPLGAIFGVPTSIFGLAMGLIGLIGAALGKEEVEKTLKTVFLLNLVGCIVLFCYSLFALGSLCPMCTVYYVLSAAAFFMLFKKSDLDFSFDLKAAGWMAIVVLIPSAIMSFQIGSKQKKSDALEKQYVEQFRNLKDYGDPNIESPYKIHMATENFADAPIRISIFSDFQCPYCKLAAEQVPKILEDFKTSVNIQYFFYPLDSTCNSRMKGSAHAYACLAAFLAACDQSKFVEVHDFIFENQALLSSEGMKALKEWEQKFELSGCMENKTVQDKIQQTLNAGDQFKLSSTPTIIINGKKLTGIIPYPNLKGILQSLIK